MSATPTQDCTRDSPRLHLAFDWAPRQWKLGFATGRDDKLWRVTIAAKPFSTFGRSSPA
jgi:hypothetical protein